MEGPGGKAQNWTEEKEFELESSGVSFQSSVPRLSSDGPRLNSSLDDNYLSLSPEASSRGSREHQPPPFWALPPDQRLLGKAFGPIADALSGGPCSQR